MRPKTNALLCDSIHPELNGKFILVGVVSGAIQTNGPDIDERYALYVAFSDLSVGSHMIDLRLTTPEKVESFTSSSIPVPEENVSAILHIEGIPFQTKKSGRFKMEWKFRSEKRWKFLLDLCVELDVPLTQGQSPFIGSPPAIEPQTSDG